MLHDIFYACRLHFQPYCAVDYVCLVASDFRTLAALWLIAQPVKSLFAALAALSLHVDFAAALASNQTDSDVRHAVADSSVQRAQRVTVTGCKQQTG